VNALFYQSLKVILFLYCSVQDAMMHGTVGNRVSLMTGVITKSFVKNVLMALKMLRQNSVTTTTSDQEDRLLDHIMWETLLLLICSTFRKMNVI
jgi:uncharacterized membrane protein YagU involved in acid resistance